MRHILTSGAGGGGGGGDDDDGGDGGSVYNGGARDALESIGGNNTTVRFSAHSDPILTSDWCGNCDVLSDHVTPTP